MIISTTNDIEGKTISKYHGVVSGQVIYGVNIFRDITLKMMNIKGGRLGSYETILKKGFKQAIDQMQKEAETFHANAVLGIRTEYEFLGKKNEMVMVAVIGTAVSIDNSDE
jgi:uncharacterized protein YbjQ (UPF0145 family)